MEKAKFSKELLDKMTDFVITEIGSKALDGITYVMALKDGRYDGLYKRCMDIKKEVLNCGFNENEAFRVYELKNGYIFDMDMSVVKRITIELSKAVAKINGNTTAVGDLIGDSPSARRKDDMLALAKYIKKSYDSGKDKVEVALFSRNSVNRIIVSCTGPDGKPIAIKYNSYAIRHWDIESINANILVPAGLRVSKLEPCEVLPSRNGVKFILYIERL